MACELRGFNTPSKPLHPPTKSRHKDATAWMTPHLVPLMIAHSRTPVNPSSGHIPSPSSWPPSASQARHLPHPGKARSPATQKPTKCPEPKKPSPRTGKVDRGAMNKILSFSSIRISDSSRKKEHPLPSAQFISCVAKKAIYRSIALSQSLSVT